MVRMNNSKVFDSFSAYIFSDYTLGLKLYIDRVDFIPLMDTFSSGLVNLIRVGFNFPDTIL